MILLALITSLLLTGSAWAGESCQNTCELVAPNVQHCTLVNCISDQAQREWDEQQAKIPSIRCTEGQTYSTVQNGCVSTPSLNDVLAPAETVGDVHVDWVPQPGVSTLDCLAKMEAAMRAMDEFTPKREWPQLPLTSANTLRANIPCVSDDCLKADRLAEAENDFAKARAELDRVKRREDSITQWESTKRECWREP